MEKKKKKCRLLRVPSAKYRLVSFAIWKLLGNGVDVVYFVPTLLPV